MAAWAVRWECGECETADVWTRDPMDPPDVNVRFSCSSCGAPVFSARCSRFDAPQAQIETPGAKAETVSLDGEPY